jgi:hypothetical protein
VALADCGGINENMIVTKSIMDLNMTQNVRMIQSEM